MKLANNGLRLWLFRILVTAAVFLFIWAFLMPWWHLTISHPLVHGDLPEVRVFSYGLRHNLVQYASWVTEDETPYYQVRIRLDFFLEPAPS